MSFASHALSDERQLTSSIIPGSRDVNSAEIL